MQLPGATLCSLESDAGGNLRHSSTPTWPRHFTELRFHFTPRPQYPWKEPPHLLKTMLVVPKNSYGRSAVHVNVFLLPRIETRFVGRPVHILLQLLGLINFLLYQPSLLYRSDLGPDHVGFVVDTGITSEVCLSGLIFSVNIIPQSVRHVFLSSFSATIKYNFGSSHGH